MRLFDEVSAELISVDSVQIYKHADIGSNKISKELQKKYPLELIDIIEPNEVYSVGEFLKDLKHSMDKSTESNKVLYSTQLIYPWSASNPLRIHQRNKLHWAQ